MGSAFSTDTHPVSIVSTDVSGDGILDLLTANYISGNVSVAVTDGPRGSKSGDLDGDGDIDFLAINYGGNNVTSVLGTARPPSRR